MRTNYFLVSQVLDLLVDKASVKRLQGRRPLRMIIPFNLLFVNYDLSLRKLSNSSFLEIGDGFSKRFVYFCTWRINRWNNYAK